MDGKGALDLLQKVGIYELCGTDGCLCMHCEIRGVHIDVSCRKSDGAMDKIAPDFYGIKLRVHSHHLYEDGDDLEKIAREVAKQLYSNGYAIMARFCDYRHDRECLCIYCDKPRSDPAGYLCDDCLSGKSEFLVPSERDYRRLDFTIPEHFQD